MVNQKNKIQGKNGVCVSESELQNVEFLKNEIVDDFGISWLHISC